jgi:hypothetical protein
MRIGVQAVAALCSFVPFGMMLGQPLGHDEPGQLKWTGAGGCIVEFVNTPCRTVRYHEYLFGSDLGFDRTTTTECVEAFDHAGSSSKTRSSTWNRWWPLPQQTSKKTELILHPPKQVLYIDHERRIYESHEGKNRPKPYWEEDDAECSHTASHSLYLSRRLPDSIVAGVHVVGYRGRDSRGVNYEDYFAPSIGCQNMRFQMIKRGLLGWITAEYDMVVDSYVLGPPARSLFAVPTGYRQVPSILQFQSGEMKTR